MESLSWGPAATRRDFIKYSTLIASGLALPIGLARVAEAIAIAVRIWSAFRIVATLNFPVLIAIRRQEDGSPSCRPKFALAPGRAGLTAIRKSPTLAHQECRLATLSFQ